MYRSLIPVLPFQNYYYDTYSMDDIEKQLHLNRKDFITLALLLGCDYDKEGVKFIGKQKAVELLEYFRNKSLDSLDRLAISPVNI